MTRAALVASVALCAGCAAVPPAGARHLGGPLEGDGWSLRLPEGWRVWRTEGGARASRVGPRLQRVEVRLLPDGEALRAASPADAALALHAQLAAGRGDTDVALLSSAEARVATLPGFRAELAFRDARGLPLRALLRCGRGEDGWICLAYEAARVRYFERGVEELEAMAASLRRAPRRAGAESGPEGPP